MYDETKFEERKKVALERKKELQKLKDSKISPKAKKTLRGVVALLIVAVIVGVIIFTSAGFVKRSINAVKVGSEKVSAAEFNYYYNQQAQSVYTTYYSYFGGQYMPFDMTKKLSSQQYSETQSWADYLTDEAVTTLEQIKIMNSEAKKNGYMLSADGQLAVDQAMASILSYAQASNLSMDKYLASVYGNGMNEELMRKIQTEVQLANEYISKVYDEPSYSEEDLASYFDEVKDDLTYVDIRYYPFLASAATDTVPEVSLDKAKEYAERVVNGASSPEAYSSTLVTVLTDRVHELYGEDYDTSSYGDSSEHLQTSKNGLLSVDESLAKWAFDEEHEVGEAAVIQNADNTGYYAVYLMAKPYRNDYNSVDLRELYIAVDTTTEADAMAAAFTKAGGYLTEWQEGEATEESFAELCDKYSDASLEGGLVEKCAKGNDAVSEWAFDSARQPGDVTAIQGESGCYVVYYIGQNTPYWQIQVESAKRSADYEAVYSTLKEQYPVSRDAFGLSMKVEPFL